MFVTTFNSEVVIHFTTMACQRYKANGITVMHIFFRNVKFLKIMLMNKRIFFSADNNLHIITERVQELNETPLTDASRKRISGDQYFYISKFSVFLKYEKQTCTYETLTNISQDDYFNFRFRILCLFTFNCYSV